MLSCHHRFRYSKQTRETIDYSVVVVVVVVVVVWEVISCRYEMYEQHGAGHSCWALTMMCSVGRARMVVVVPDRGARCSFLAVARRPWVRFPIGSCSTSDRREGPQTVAPHRANRGVNFG